MVEAICIENCWAVSFQHGMKLFKFMTSILAVFTTNVLQFWMKENVIYFMYFLYSWLEQVIAIKEDITSYYSQAQHRDKNNFSWCNLNLKSRIVSKFVTADWRWLAGWR